MVKSTFIILLLHSINSALGAAPYNLLDLEALEKEKNFEEFLQHVNDIRPGLRDKHWREMYQSMAMSLVDFKIKTKDFNPDSFHQIEQIGKSSALANDEFFQLKRSIYAKKYLSACFKKVETITNLENRASEKTRCETELGSYWYFSKKEADTGIDLAQILEDSDSHMNRWPYYAVAVKDSIAKLYCQKPQIQAAIIKKFYEETFNPDFKGDYKVIIERLISEKCFDELVIPLKSSLKSNEVQSLDKEMSLNLLEAKGKLTSLEMDFFAILYLLDGPVVGDKMNLAWKKVESLSENFQKRQTLLNEIKNLSIIPDKIFQDPELPRQKAIINLFAKNFPELLDYYGSSCIKFLSNTTLAPQNISSSAHCHEFLKAAEVIKIQNKNQSMGGWVSDAISTQYSAIKRRP